MYYTNFLIYVKHMSNSDYIELDSNGYLIKEMEWSSTEPLQIIGRVARAISNSSDNDIIANDIIIGKIQPITHNESYKDASAYYKSHVTNAPVVSTANHEG
jgi:hypothetical protein